MHVIRLFSGISHLQYGPFTLQHKTIKKVKLNVELIYFNSEVNFPSKNVNLP